MGKKKFNRDDEDEGSTDEDSEHPIITGSNNATACPHVGKAVNISDLKKALKTAWVRIGKCSQCEKDKKGDSAQKMRPPGPGDAKKKNNSTSKKSVSSQAAPPLVVPPQPKIIVDPNTPVDIWLCLRCATQSCCPSDAPNPTVTSHAMQHFTTPRSDLHCVVVNVNNWKLWCYECKFELYLDSYKKLHESVDHVKRVSQTKSVTLPAISAAKKELAIFVPGGPVKNSVGVSPNSVLPRARGLNNLGNTCFFNSVMQCLSATHPFVRCLDTHCQKGAQLNIPAVTVAGSKTVKRDDSGLGVSRDGSTKSSSDDLDNDRVQMTTQIDPLSLQLLESGAITLAVAAFFKEMHSVSIKSGPVNPGHLFGQICRRSPQFRGFQQQDAHELLRHLMDGLRSEEVRRQRSAILKHFGLNEKSDPKKVEDKIRMKVNALSKHSMYTIIDKIFGGHLVSTIVCEQCHNSSQIYEPFLDLSLPLVDQKPPRPGGGSSKGPRNSINDDDGGDISCFGKNKKKSDGDIEGDVEPVKTKFQAKKERAKAKKDRKKNKHRNKNGTMDAAGDGDGDVPDETEVKTEEEQKNSTENISENFETACENKDPEEETNSKNDDTVPEPEQEVAAQGEEVKLEKELRENEKNNSRPAKAKSTTAKVKPSSSKKKKGGGGDTEEYEEDGYSEEAEDDWDWDYGEQWNEDGNNAKQENEAVKDEQESDYLDVNDIEEESASPAAQPVKQSLNPLPPEMLERGSSEREKSSEPLPDEVSESSETGASSNGDVEDNLDEPSCPIPITEESPSFTAKLADPFCPDSNHLDPHMEELCRRVRKLSVASSNVIQDDTPNDFVESILSRHPSKSGEEAETEEGLQLLRLKQDWIARSLTSIAPRYHSNTGECSIYSSLSQFTAPELLTGSNRWACDRCTQLQHASNQSESEDSGTDVKTTKKPQTVYSNASKQLLVFSPPAVLTIHLKRFQQTMSSLRKDNRHVKFPIDLNLAPFCSATSISVPNMEASKDDISYNLYGVVEHSGRLQGGHYTAYVKVRPTQSTDFGRFFSEPTLRTDDIQFLMSEIERKCREKAAKAVTETSHDSTADPGLTKWYHISDSSVAEVSEDRVLKCQAYLLFYERVR